MKLLLAPLLLAVSLPAFAEVDSKIHKLCIEAKDYAGCVRAMKGETMPTSRQINSQGADIAEGNQCPSGYAYLGGGNCREVQCRYGKSAAGGHDYRLAGKPVSWRKKDRWYCDQKFIYTGVLRFTESEMRASNNPSCPPGEPKLGYNNTCDTQALDPAMNRKLKELKKRKSEFYN